MNLKYKAGIHFWERNICATPLVPYNGRCKDLSAIAWAEARGMYLGMQRNSCTIDPPDDMMTKIGISQTAVGIASLAKVYSNMIDRILRIVTIL